MRSRALLPLLLLMLASCDQLFEKPRISVRRVDLVSVSFTGISANVVFAVDNPNVIGVDLASLRYQLTVDNHPFVAGNNQNTLHVPARGTGELQLPISVQFVQLGEAIQSLISKRQVGYSIDTTLGFGTPIGVIQVPIGHRGTFPVPQLPTLAVGNAVLGSAGIESANVSVSIQVHNPNPFPLPLGNLRTAVAINGVSLANASTPAQSLAANGTVPLTLGARLDYLSAGLGIVRAIQSRSATISLDGSLDLIGYTLPVHLQTTLR